MKGYVCLFIVLTATVVFAQSNGSADEGSVLRVQQQWLDASQHGNVEALSEIIDDNFVGSTPSDQIIGKQSLLPPTGKPAFSNTHFVNLTANVIGDTAVVFGGMVTPDDSTSLRCAMVYAKRAGTWKMIAAQLVPVSKGKN